MNNPQKTVKKNNNNMEPTTTASIVMPSPLSLIWAGLFAGAGITGGMYVTRKGGEYVGSVIESMSSEETKALPAKAKPRTASKKKRRP